MKNFWSKYKFYIVLFLGCLAIMLAYQFLWISPDRLGGNDSYTHIAKAELLKEQGITAASYPSFLPFTYWAVINADNTLIFDYLLLGLLTISSSVAFFKVVIALIFASVTTTFYKVLSFGQQHRFITFLLTAISVVGNVAFFLKFTELRSLVFSIVLFFLSLALLFVYKKRPYLFIPLAFAYTLLHTTVFLIFVPIIILTIFDFKNWKTYLMSLVYSFIGIALAVLIYPSENFLQILVMQPIIPFIYRTIPFKVDGAFEVAGDISNPGYLLVSNIVNIVVLLSGTILYALAITKKYKFKITRFKLASAVLFVLFFALDLFSRRFSDYLTPTMLIFLILHKDDFAPLFTKLKPFVIKFKATIALISIICLVGFGVVFYQKYLKDNFTNTDYKGDAKSNLPESYYTSMYINQNVQQGSCVFNNAWEDFPYFIYYSRNYKYAAGMELGFMYLYNHDMLMFYQDFRAKRNFEDTGSDLIYTPTQTAFKTFIQDNFKTNVIAVKKGKSETMANFLKDNYARLGLTRAYDDEFYSLYSF